MKQILAGLGLGLMVACTQTPPVSPSSEGFRDSSAQIASQTDVTAERMAGEWVVRQRYAGQAGPPYGLSLTALPQGALQMSVLESQCDGDVCTGVQKQILLQPSGPGRWTPVGPQDILPDAEIWVMWMDYDNRTAALGTPSGAFGWIIDKELNGGADRIVAARDIMAWFGYDVARLQAAREN